jgi:hypothetical protein
MVSFTFQSVLPRKRTHDIQRLGSWKYRADLDMVGKKNISLPIPRIEPQSSSPQLPNVVVEWF